MPHSDESGNIAVLVLGAIALVGMVVFGITPLVVRSMLNTVTKHDPYPVSEESRAVHESLVVCDLHADPLMWRQDILMKNGIGHVDVPRLLEGNVSLQVFAAPNKFPGPMEYQGTTFRIDAFPALAIAHGWPPSTWFSPKGRVLHESAKLHTFAEESGGRLHIVKTAQDLDTFLAQREDNRQTVAGLLSIEGTYCLERDLGNLDALYDAGYRMVGLTHFSDAAAGGSSNGLEKGGITPFGKEVVAGLEERGMIIDLAHASPALISDVLDIATRPLVVSHTGLHGDFDNIRNLSDEHAKQIAEQGGIIGMAYFDDAIGEVSVESVIRALCYAVDLLGVEHVALGSDFDGGTGTPFDTSELAVVTHGLLESGLSEEDVAAVMGDNVIRLLGELLPQTDEAE